MRLRSGLLVLVISNCLAQLSPAKAAATAQSWNFKFDQWQIKVSKDEVAYPFFIRNVHALRITGKDYSILYLNKSYIPVSKSSVNAVAGLLQIPTQEMQTLDTSSGGNVFQFKSAHATQWLSTQGGHLIATVETQRKDGQALAQAHLATVVQK